MAFWRVETIDHDRLLGLQAEMKVPGLAWLQFEAVPVDAQLTNLIQTVYFPPKGLFGFLHWYGLHPIHGLIFSRMIHKLARQTEEMAS